MIHQYELKAEDVRAYTIQTRKKHFQIEAHGYCCTTDMIYDILMKASAECSSLEATCADLEQVADSNTVREYVNQALPIRSLRQQKSRPIRLWRVVFQRAWSARALRSPLTSTTSRSKANRKACER